ncbi:reverse transcriptase [Tanacetum coccineum]
MVNGGLGRQAIHFMDNTPEAEKVKIIFVHLDDKALLWHRQFVKIIGDNVGWEMYTTAIIQRFRYVFEDPMAALKNAKYEKSAKEYQDLFDTLLCRVDISQEHVVSLYLGGLPTELEICYTPGNKCSGQLYSLMVVPKEKEEYFEVEEGNEELFVQDEIPQISLSALNGSNTFQTMRVTGNVGKD